MLAGTAGYGIPGSRLPFLAYAVCNGKPNYTGFLQLKQIPFLICPLEPTLVWFLILKCAQESPVLNK